MYEGRPGDVLELQECPAEGCIAPAEVRFRYTVPGSAGMKRAKLLCLKGHEQWIDAPEVSE